MKKLGEDLIRTKRWLQPSGGVETITLQRFIDLYLVERLRMGKAERTIETDAYALNRLLDSLGDCTLVSITPETARRYRDCKIARVKPAAAGIELRHLRAAFNWAAEKTRRQIPLRQPVQAKGIDPDAPEQDPPVDLLTGRESPLSGGHQGRGSPAALPVLSADRLPALRGGQSDLGGH